MTNSIEVGFEPLMCWIIKNYNNIIIIIIIIKTEIISTQPMLGSLDHLSNQLDNYIYIYIIVNA